MLRPRPARRASAGPATLELVSRISALVAGSAAVVYTLGAVSLVLRLVHEDLPWQPVVSQLPRDLLLSAGATSVVLGIIVALAHLMLWFVFGTPVSGWDPAWRRRSTVLRVLRTWLLLLVPFVVAWVYRFRFALPTETVGPVTCSVVAVVLLGWAAVVVRARGTIGRRRLAAPLISLLWGFLSLPAFVAATSVIPLNDAKVCTVSDYEERGLLIGRTADGVILAEPPGAGRQRITIFPADQVKQEFVGPLAWTTDCDVDDARLAVVALRESRDARDRASDATRLLDAYRAAGPAAPPKAATEALDAAGDVGLAAYDVADAARDLGRDELELRSAAGDVLAAVGRARDRLKAGVDATAEIQAAVTAAGAAAGTADGLAQAVLEEAVARQPS